MSFIRNAVPASLRRPVESFRFAPARVGHVAKASLTSDAEARAISIAKSRFARLPEEPEDARITGVTRSLNRRLLALNVPGSLRMATKDLLAKDLFPLRKIA